MKNYVVATLKDWNINQFNQNRANLSGHWTLIQKKEQLNIDNLRSLKPKYIFFPHWSWIVPKEVLEEFTCICFHMTDVPYGRGGSPLQNLISRGHIETKLTALKMTSELDAGPVYLKVPLSLKGSAQEIFDRSAKLTFEMIKTIISLEPAPIEQSGEVTIFERRTPKQSEIQGDETFSKLYDLIRMMDAQSYPKAYINYGDYTLTFENAHLSNHHENTKLKNTITAQVIMSKKDISKVDINNDK